MITPEIKKSCVDLIFMPHKASQVHTKTSLCPVLDQMVREKQEGGNKISLMSHTGKVFHMTQRMLHNLGVGVKYYQDT